MPKTHQKQKPKQLTIWSLTPCNAPIQACQNLLNLFKPMKSYLQNIKKLQKQMTNYQQHVKHLPKPIRTPIGNFSNSYQNL